MSLRSHHPPRVLRYNVIDTSSHSPTHQGGLLGFTIPEHETTKGWATGANPTYPQHILIELTRAGSHIDEIRVLAHEHWIPSSMDVFASFHSDEDPDMRTRLGYLGAVEFKDLKAKNGDRLREQKMIKLSLDGCDRVKLVFNEPHLEVVTNPERKVGIVQLLVYGHPNKDPTAKRAHVHTHLKGMHHAHHHGHNKGKHYHRQDSVDHELHALGLTTMAEMSTTSVALQDQLTKMGIVKTYADASTASVLDMIRVRKIRSVEESDIATASRLAMMFTAFDRLSTTVQNANHAKIKSVKHQHYGHAIEARRRLELVESHRDVLVEREALRSWCCGGRNSHDYEIAIDSQLKTGLVFGAGDEKNGVSASVQALLACNLSDLPANLRSFSGKDLPSSLQTVDADDQEEEADTETQQKVEESEEETEEEDKGPLVTGNEMNRFCRSLLGQYFGQDGREYEMGLRKPEPLQGNSPREVTYVRVFGDFFTQCLLSKVWSLRQVAAAVLQVIVDENIPFLKAFIKHHKLTPGEFFFLASEAMLELIDDRVALVFEQVSETLESLYSILWQDERQQRKRSYPVIVRLCRKLSRALNTKVMTDALDLLMFFASKDFCGPPFVSGIVVRELRKVLKTRASAQTILGILSAYEMMLEEFGLVTDELIPPGEEQALTIIQGCTLAVELMKSRHDEVREAGADLGTHLYAMDKSFGAEASRSILRYGRGYRFAAEWSETLIRRFYEIDLELKRPVHADDEAMVKAAEARNMPEEESDQIKSLKKQLGEMRALQAKMLGKGEAEDAGKKPKTALKSREKIAKSEKRSKSRDGSRESSRKSSRAGEGKKKIRRSKSKAADAVPEDTGPKLPSEEEENTVKGSYEHLIESDAGGELNAALLRSGFEQIGLLLPKDVVEALVKYFYKMVYKDGKLSYRDFKLYLIDQKWIGKGRKKMERAEEVKTRFDGPVTTEKLRYEEKKRKEREEEERQRRQEEEDFKKGKEALKERQQRKERIKKKIEKSRNKFWALLNIGEGTDTIEAYHIKKMVNKLAKFDKTIALPEEKEFKKVIRIGFAGKTIAGDLLESVIDYADAVSAEEKKEMKKASAFHMRMYNMMETIVRYIDHKSKAKLEMEEMKLEKKAAEKAKKQEAENTKKKKERVPGEKAAASDDGGKGSAGDKPGTDAEPPKKGKEDDEQKKGGKETKGTKAIPEGEGIETTPGGPEAGIKKGESGPGDADKEESMKDEQNRPGETIPEGKEKNGQEDKAEGKKYPSTKEAQKSVAKPKAPLAKLKTATNVIVKTKGKSKDCTIS